MNGYDPRSEYFPRDLQRTYTIRRRSEAAQSWRRLGTYLAQRSPLQGDASYSQDGLSEQHEERINLPIDADVQIGDVLTCAEDGQSWSVGAVRRQPTFRVAYLKRATLSRGDGKAAFS